MNKIIMMMVLSMMGVVSYAQSGKINPDSLGVTQVNFGDCDSLIMRHVEDRYGVIYKNGKCGIYDIVYEVNVTEIEFDELGFSKRILVEDDAYVSYYYCVKEGRNGILGVNEESDSFMTIWMSKEND